MLDWQIWWGDEPLHLPGAEIYCASGTCDLEAGTAGTLSVTLPPTHKLANADFLTGRVAREVTLRDGNTELFRGRIISNGRNMDAETEIQCEGMLAYLKDTVVRPYACRSTTDLPTGTKIITQDPFAYLLAQHNHYAGPEESFDLGVNPHPGAVRASTDFKSTWEEMNDAFCTGLDRYLYAYTNELGSRVLCLLDGGRGEGNQAVVLGENIIDINLARDMGDIVTVIVARGTHDDTKNMADRERPARDDFGLEEISDGPIITSWGMVHVDGDRIYNQTLVDRYGWREEMRHYEASTASELVKLAAEDLNPENAGNNVVNSVEVSGIDLSVLNPSLRPLRLLEWTRVYCPPHGINQWLPCSKIHIEIGDPGACTYLFGDLPETLTRKSALRMGMLARSTGELIRKADGTLVDTDRTWSRADEIQDGVDVVDEKVEKDRQEEEEYREKDRQEEEEYREENQKQVDGLIDGLEEIGDGIIDLEKNFNSEIDGLRTLVDANEKEAADNLANLEEAMGGQIGRLDDLIGNTDKKIDGVSQLTSKAQERAEQAAAEAAKALLGSVYYGTCNTAASTQTKVVTGAAAGNGKAFKLENGVMAIITFTYENTSDRPAININGTGAHYIKTNGIYEALWKAGQSVGLMYDNGVWTTPSSPVWTTQVMAGNPLGFNFFTDGTKIALRYGDQQYITGDTTGIQVGFTAIKGTTTAVGTRNIYIGSNRMALRQGQTEFLSLDDDGIQVGMDNWPNIHVGSSELAFRRPESGGNDLNIAWSGGSAPQYNIYSKAGLELSNNLATTSNRSFLSIDKNGTTNLYGASSVNVSSIKSVLIGTTSAVNTIQFFGSSFTLNRDPLELPALVDMVRTSLILTGDGSEYLWVNKRDLGLASAENLSHYAFFVTNGDRAAYDFFPIGTAKTDDSLVIKLDRGVTGRVRLNVVGIQTKTWNPTMGYN